VPRLVVIDQCLFMVDVQQCVGTVAADRIAACVRLLALPAPQEFFLGVRVVLADWILARVCRCR
jgi:hypothetical protein